MFGFFKRHKKKHGDAAHAEKEQSAVQQHDATHTVAPAEAPQAEQHAAVGASHAASPAATFALAPESEAARAEDTALSADYAAAVEASPGVNDAASEIPAAQRAHQPELSGEPAAPAVEADTETRTAPQQEEAIAPEEQRATADLGRALPADAPAGAAAEKGHGAPLTEEARQGGFFSRIRRGLSKTRSQLTGGLTTLFLGRKQIDDELLEALETELLMADVGIAATTDIMEQLTERVSRKELADAGALYQALKQTLRDMLVVIEQPLALPPKGEGPFVILVVGVNGVGKTTTIGKMAHRFQQEGRSVMLAAGDTFRAAAVEQLTIWGERNGVPVVAQHTGADSASVIYDALSAARARKIDVLIADTAGRLHNKAHLMEELRKVRRVMGKLDELAPHEVMLVLDAGTGQNAIAQAQTFSDAAPVTGLTLTKLDGTAKGGVIFALAQQLGIPLRFIGVGESLEDLRPFEAQPFIEALFDSGKDEQSD